MIGMRHSVGSTQPKYCSCGRLCGWKFTGEGPAVNKTTPPQQGPPHSSGTVRSPPNLSSPPAYSKVVCAGWELGRNICSLHYLFTPHLCIKSSPWDFTRPLTLPKKRVRKQGKHECVCLHAVETSEREPFWTPMDGQMLWAQRAHMCFVKTGIDHGTLVPVVSVKFFPLKILFSLCFSLERAGLET